MDPHKDDKQEAIEHLLGGDPREFVAAWLEAISASSDEEVDWREKDAEDATLAYRGDKSSSSSSFNIFHSNVETLVPTLYNSQPIPDVRRRFNDEDPVAAEVSELIERSLSFCIDDYDFEDKIKRVVKDMVIVDRGVAWVRYVPTFDETGENVVYEEARCEYVPWRLFRRGPGVTWEDMPWVARLHFLNRDEVKKLVMESGQSADVQARILGTIRYHSSAEDKGDKKDDGRETPKFGGRARVWEIWDKDTRTVVHVSEDYTEYPISVKPDPLGLANFFPTPRPAMVIESTDSLTPTTSYSIYSRLLIELNDLTDRIDHLTAQIKVRGGYASAFSGMESIARAPDGELVPLENTEVFSTAGGDLNKAIVWWPLEQIYKALEVLVAQREVVKQTIYEVTGLSDIIRGSTNAEETATAQQIKQQWGSIRIKGHQGEVERYVRDLFRLKAEIFSKHFSLQTLLMMSGFKYPTQEEKERAQAIQQAAQQKIAEFQQQMQMAEQAGDEEMLAQLQQLGQQAEAEFAPQAAQIEEILEKPTLEEIEGLLKNDRLRKYRVDVESDSTIRGDLTKNQEQMKGFLDGFAAFVSSVGPMVQQMPSFAGPAVEILSAFCRTFRLGKQAESAIDEFADKIRKDGVDGPAPDPTVEATAAKLQAETQKIHVETELLPQEFAKTQEREDQKFQAESQERERRYSLDEQKAQHESRRGYADLNLKGQVHKDTMSMKDRELQQADAQFGFAEDNKASQFNASLEEQRAGRQEQERMARLQLQDGRSARKESYQAAAVPGPNGEPAPPIPNMEPLEEMAPMTEQESAVLAEVAASVQSLAQSQAESTQALAEAIREMAKAITAPKQLIRDHDGRAVGVRTMEG